MVQESFREEKEKCRREIVGLRARLMILNVDVEVERKGEKRDTNAIKTLIIDSVWVSGSSLRRRH